MTGTTCDILFVVYTDRVRQMVDGVIIDVTRIISARYATEFERGLYYGKINDWENWYSTEWWRTKDAGEGESNADHVWWRLSGNHPGKGSKISESKSKSPCSRRKLISIGRRFPVLICFIRIADNLLSYREGLGLYFFLCRIKCGTFFVCYIR